MINILTLFKKITRVKEDLQYLVHPVVREDIRSQLGELQECLDILEKGEEERT